MKHLTVKDHDVSDQDPSRLVDPEVSAVQSDSEHTGTSGGRGHWLMVACCIPMLVIAIVLVASGASIGTLVIAAACTAMMALMMIGMMRAG